MTASPEKPAEYTSNLPAHRSLAVHRLHHGHPRSVAHGRTAIPSERSSRVHGHASIGFLTSGRHDIWMDCAWTIGPGDLFIVPEGAPHFGLGPGPEAAQAPAEGVGLSICSSCLHNTPAEALVTLFESVRDGAAAVRTLAEADQPLFLQLTDALERELATAGVWQSLAVDGLLTTLAAIILRAETPPNAALRKPTLSGRALSYIQRHASSALSLSDVAHHLARSPTHVAAVVKRETGRTVLDWITDARMSQARRLLLRTDEPIETIADRLGYASPSHFHRTFKRAHGLPPGAWRRAHLD